MARHRMCSSYCLSPCWFFFLLMDFSYVSVRRWQVGIVFICNQNHLEIVTASPIDCRISINIHAIKFRLKHILQQHRQLIVSPDQAC